MRRIDGWTFFCIGAMITVAVGMVCSGIYYSDRNADCREAGGVPVRGVCVEQSNIIEEY